MSSEASIQFIQAVKPYDSNSSLLITVLNSLLTDDQYTSLSTELLKEICETNFIATQADNAAAKTMATFIIDMTRPDPHIIRTHINQTTDLLTAESHHIRVVALTAFCSIIDKLLLSDDSDDEQTKMCDDLLQILHIYCLRFMDLIEQTNRHVVYLFNSFTLTDCKQVVDFFVNLRHYHLVLPNIEQSLRLMFSLIWFRALEGATFSEELCFEEILKQLIKGTQIVTEPITEAL
ncbi:unnamed protein product [Rotaria sp. Silwood2]|nr:unnamed protein product [Rotaria sp. Silwood2]